MAEFLSKLSSYNIFNYLLPGILFGFVASSFTRYNFISADLIIGIFIYYFIGMVISRFGSLVLEPLLKRTSFLRFADYEDYIAASAGEPKIELLSEVNNTYRTLCSALILLGLLRLYQEIENRISGLGDWNVPILLVILLITFLLSYRKQTGYISRRVVARKRE